MKKKNMNIRFNKEIRKMIFVFGVKYNMRYVDMVRKYLLTNNSLPEDYYRLQNDPNYWGNGWTLEIKVVKFYLFDNEFEKLEYMVNIYNIPKSKLIYAIVTNKDETLHSVYAYTKSKFGDTDNVHYDKLIEDGHYLIKPFMKPKNYMKPVNHKEYANS